MFAGILTDDFQVDFVGGDVSIAQDLNRGGECWKSFFKGQVQHSGGPPTIEIVGYGTMWWMEVPW